MKPLLRSIPFAAIILMLAGAASLPANAQTQQNSGASMSSITQATIIHRFYEECLNRGRLDLLPELVSANVINHIPEGSQTGLAAFQQTVTRARSMFTGQHFTVDDVVSDGDKAAARWTMVAANTIPIGSIEPTGRQITEHAIVFYRFEDGKIAEVWMQLDRLGVLQQLGVQIPGIPAPPARHAQ